MEDGVDKLVSLPNLSRSVQFRQELVGNSNSGDSFFSALSNIVL